MNTASRPAHQQSSKLDETDKRLQRINETILPDAPYLMDLITPSGYRLPPHQMNDWRRSCPFDKYEEQLQYMTFLPHTARGDTMLRTVGNWDDGEGKTKNESAKAISGNSSGNRSPAAGQLPKKKISLAGYMNKKGGQSSGRTSPKAGIDEKSTNNQSESTARPMVKEPPSTGAPNRVQHTAQKHETRPPKSAVGRKRSADAVTESQDAQIFNAPLAAPPMKKIHTTKKTTQETAGPPKANGNIHGLPRMLSPTLPASVEEQLAKLRGGDLPPLKRANESPAMAASKKPRDNSHPAAVKTAPKTIPQHKHTVSQGGETSLQTNQPAPRQDPHSADPSRKAKDSKSSVTTSAEDGVETKTPVAGLPNDAAESLKPNGQTKPSGELPNKVDRDNAKRLIIVLKIAKRLRRDCKRILQLKPHRTRIAGQEALTPSHSRNPSKESPMIKGGHDQQTKQERVVNGNDNRGEDNTKSKSTAVANGIGTTKPSEKRQQTNEDKESLQRPRKRQKPSDIDSGKPRTPIAAALRSPSIFHPTSTHKSQLSTPKSTFKSSAMSRIGSAEGDVKTPLGPTKGSTPAAPNSAERLNNNRPTSDGSMASSSTAGPSSNKNGDAAFYKAEFNKYADMARSLKRATDSLAKLPDGTINTDTVARRQGLALAIETTLCYMLAFTLKDEPARLKRVAGDRTAWLSLLPYFKFLTSVMQGTESSHLQGFFYQLEAVCRDTIFDYDVERLEHAIINSTEEQQAELTAFQKSMAENARLAKVAWKAGTRMLTIDDFKTEFPTTWDKRSKSFLDASRGKENLTLGKYGEGGFYLPLSGASSSIQAVRAGWSFLEEWCKKEGVQWEGKMGL
ncbi:MAG: hypothetical protein Q9222_001457 [Ikaeria aurantiellina]